MGGAIAASSDPLNCTIMSPFASALTDRVTLTAGIAHVNTRTEYLGEEERSLTTLFPTVVAILPYKRVSFMTGLFLEKEGRLTFAATDTAYGESTISTTGGRHPSTQSLFWCLPAFIVGFWCPRGSFFPP